MLSGGAVEAATLEVGPGQVYAKPCAAIAAAAPGDTVLIDAAGSYNGDVCAWTTNGLTIRGFNGRPHIDAAGHYAARKGIWVIDANDTTVENIELSGAAVPDGNGAGIKLEGINLTMRNCYFHNNQAGLLTSNPQQGEIFIEYSEFAYNGAGDGQTHNIYIGQVAKFTLQYSYSHDAYGGQLVKTRAAENHILYNRLTNQYSRTSYEIDISNGGLSYVIGNMIYQGIYDLNDAILGYMKEGATAFNSNWQLFVINNTFVNAMPLGVFLNIGTADLTPVVAENNIFYGAGTIVSQASAVLSHNLTGVDPKFVNPSYLDYHLQSTSPAINMGMDPGTGGGLSLNPDYQYVHPTCGQTRNEIGIIDIGAFEYGGAGSMLSCVPSAGTPALSSITANPSTITGGNTGAAVVQLTAPAPAGGLLVSLSSSSGSVASIPSSVTVPAGAANASVLLTTGGVTASTTVQLSATYSGVTTTSTVTVTPVSTASPTTFALSAPSTATMGSNITVTWTAPAGRPVNDYIGLYTPTGWFNKFWWTQGATSGSFTVTLPSVAGKYYFKYFLGTVGTLVAQAGPIVVN